jgi:hypothetical protein
VARSTSLPVTIAAGGAARLDLVVEAELPRAPSDGSSLPLSYTLSLSDAGGTAQNLAARLDAQRQATPNAPAHAATAHTLDNPTRGDLTVTAAEISPDFAPPLTITPRRPRYLPWSLLVAGAVVLLALAVPIDRLPALADNDGGLTLATGTVLGTAGVLMTSHTAEPTFGTLAGSVILGGTLGYAGAALVWWVVKRARARPAR